MSNDYDSGFDDPFADASSPLGGNEASPFDEAVVADVPNDDEASGRTEGLELPKFRRPKVDLYSVLLILSLVFIIVATAIHYFETTAYEYGTPSYKEGSPIAKPAPKS